MDEVITNDTERQIRIYSTFRNAKEQRIREILNVHHHRFNEEALSIFIPDTGPSENDSTDLWIFSDKTAIKAKDFLNTNDDFLRVPIFKCVKWFETQPSDAWMKGQIGSAEQLGETPYSIDNDPSYTLSATIHLEENPSPLTFHATGMNCSILKHLIDKHIKPNVIDRD